MEQEIELSFNVKDGKNSREITENENFVAKDVDKKDKIAKKILKRKKNRLLITLVCGNFFVGCCYAVMAPVLPREAEKKHISTTAYGFIFGIYEITMFVFSPICGKIIPILKPAFMMKVGMLVSGVCNILFGLLDYAPAGPWFIALAMAIRFCDALGATAFTTASFTTIATELHHIVGRAMSMAETSFSLGMAAGPAVGGFFYQLGGFRLPFMIMGSVLIVQTGINIFLFSKDDSDIPLRSISTWALFLDIDIFIDILAMNSAHYLLAFNEMSLEPHIRQFNLSPSIEGLVFLTSGLTVAVFAFIWGYLAEKLPNAQYLTFLGSLLVIVSYLILGPASFLNFKTILWVVIFSQFILGVGMSSIIVCTLTHGMKHILKIGYPNEVGTFSVVSSLLFAAGCFGAFLGPSLGGILIDHIGYIHTTEIGIGFEVVFALICFGRLLHLCIKKKRTGTRKQDSTDI